MLNFINNLFNSVVNDVKSVWNWILKTISAVYSFIDREFQVVERYATDVYNYLDGLFHTAWNFIVQVYNYAKSIVDVVIHDVVSWVTRIWNDVFSFAKGVYEQLVQWADYFKHLIASVIDDIRTWVVNNIWNPLFNSIKEALGWITHEGAMMYDLLTHPDKLVALLGGYLWSAFLGLIKAGARPIGRFLVHIMMGMAGEVADVLEAIISSLV
jgi:phage-related protein